MKQLRKTEILSRLKDIENILVAVSLTDNQARRFALGEVREFMEIVKPENAEGTGK